MSDTYDDNDPLAGYGQWRPLSSSNLDAYRYNAETRDLYIQFHGGRIYRYYNISQEMADSLGSASSPGGWWHANLKGAPFSRE